MWVRCTALSANKVEGLISHGIQEAYPDANYVEHHDSHNILEKEFFGFGFQVKSEAFYILSVTPIFCLHYFMNILSEEPKIPK